LPTPWNNGSFNPVAICTREDIGMSILGNIFGKLFGTSAQAAPANSQVNPQQAPVVPSSSGATEPRPANIDIAPILDKAVAAKGQKLNWRTSIVDLMKALDLDSSLQARQELAKELHYTGDMNDSAKMNIWLHGQVMKKVAENGGKVPADLKA
jgi:hypothetical protein